MLAVGIVFPWAATIVAYVGVVGRQTHPHADFGDNGAVCGCRLVVHLDENRVVVDDGVIDGDVLHLFPFCGALSKMGSALVVVFWLPEVGLQRPL